MSESIESLNSRLSKWKDPTYLDIPYTTSDKELSKYESNILSYLDKQSKKYRDTRNDNEVHEYLSSFGLIKSCKELIFDHDENDKPIFYAIGYAFNLKNGFLELGKSFTIEIEALEDEEITEEVIHDLALAHIFEVPVYPNTNDLVDELADYHRKLLLDGFSISMDEGKKVKFKLTKAPGAEIKNIEFLDKIKFTNLISPAEIAILKKSIEQELSILNNAKNLLSKLDKAIDDLTNLLSGSDRNEGKLQECLTANPILFGLEYSEIIPKHKLGSEYEMDYALKRSSGLYDLVEIEASTHQLFTKDGNPNHKLIHAEQQVIDWLDWVEKHNSYAREKLSDVVNPYGFIVMGTDITLGDHREKLFQRNSFFRNKFQILTYNDLLKRSKNIRKILRENEQI